MCPLFESVQTLDGPRVATGTLTSIRFHELVRREAMQVSMAHDSNPSVVSVHFYS